MEAIRAKEVELDSAMSELQRKDEELVKKGDELREWETA